jgi:hypothetical protein
MKLERYQLESINDLTVFEFISEGPKGNIVKWIQYSKINDTNYYNLAFGDKKEGENDIDDEIITDNKDSYKVLATVAFSVITFTERFKEAIIVATGSTKSRTRLYQISISQNLEELEQYFNVYGYNESQWVKYKINIPYKAFMVKRK